jgi:hypothetical protein
MPPTAWIGAALSLQALLGTFALQSISTSDSNERPAKVAGVQAQRDGGNEKDKNNEDGPHSFRIQGDIVGLHPGMRSEHLRVTVYNDNNFEMVVQQLSANVVEIVGGGGTCPKQVDGRPSVVVEPYVGSLAVAANSAATRDMTISMDAAAPDGCSGATFHLAYRGRAVKP